MRSCDARFSSFSSAGRSGFVNVFTTPSRHNVNFQASSSRARTRSSLLLARLFKFELKIKELRHEIGGQSGDSDNLTGKEAMIGSKRTSSFLKGVDQALLLKNKRFASHLTFESIVSFERKLKHTQGSEEKT